VCGGSVWAAGGFILTGGLMNTWIKQGVYGELTPEAAEGLRKVEKLYHNTGRELFITSIREGTHGTGSLHPSGNAFDIRKNGIDISYIRDILWNSFDVVVHDTHYHIEYDPK
jgi:hypothetical protein